MIINNGKTQIGHRHLFVTKLAKGSPEINSSLDSELNIGFSFRQMKVVELAIYVVRVRCYCPHSIIPNCV